VTLHKIASIVSVYKNDSLRTLQPAIESLLNQTQEVDIFVQEDGSVQEDVDKYLSDLYQEQKIHYLGKRKKNFGLAVSLNELLDVVIKKGYEYIARMDSDDISIVNRIEKQYQFMLKNEDIDVVGGYIEEFGDGFEYQKVVRYPLKHEEMYRFFAKRVPLAHVSAFYRKSFFDKAGLYPVSSPTNEDTLMWLEGFKNGCKFANISEVLIKVRVSSDFFSRRGGAKKAISDFKDRVRVIRELGYNYNAYGYAAALLIVNLVPGWAKKILYKRLR